ncbi:MAG: mandelate racemase/muconate lactonizing enzyme family protein [Planctomycetota bacterium]|nr:MAG: mandelate racemase/muconate lactonizing enzyme family protein [Planctomycetota bacterium]
MFGARLSRAEDALPAPPKEIATRKPPEGLEIVRVETFTLPRVTLVRLTTKSGLTGFGQTAPYNADITATVLHRQVAHLALRANIYEPAAFSQWVVESTYKFPGSYVRRALTGVETAMWDLRGKAEGKSVCELLGGTVGKVAVYGSSMRRDIKPQDEADRLKRLKEEFGYDAFKIRIGSVNGHDRDQWPGRTEEIVPTVRKAIGDDTALLVDANSCYTPKKAIEVGKLLADNDVCHFEEPCPYWEYEWTAEVTRALDVPVAGGEQDCFLPGWRRMIAMRAVDIAQPDVCYIGGISRARQVAEMADAAQMSCVPHSANLSMVTLFTAHLLRAIPNAGPFMEFSIEPNTWTGELYRPQFQVVDGEVSVPEGPGWGVEVPQETLDKAERQVTEA